MIENKQKKGCSNCFWGQIHTAIDSNQLNNIYIYTFLLFYLAWCMMCQQSQWAKTEPNLSLDLSNQHVLLICALPPHQIFFSQFHSKLFIHIQAVVIIVLRSSSCVSFGVCLFCSAQKCRCYRWFSYQFGANGAIIM